MEWSTHQVVEATGLTSRTLRHFDQLALVRLQRILLLRDMGMPLAEIADILGGDITDKPSKSSVTDSWLKAANYNRVSTAGPQFVRDAIHHWADEHLTG